jgi:hypothetical protein
LALQAERGDWRADADRAAFVSTLAGLLPSVVLPDLAGLAPPPPRSLPVQGDSGQSRLAAVSTDDLYNLFKSAEEDPLRVLVLDLRAKDDYRYSHMAMPLRRLACVNISGGSLHPGVTAAALEQALGVAAFAGQAFRDRGAFKTVVFVTADASPTALAEAVCLFVRGLLLLLIPGDFFVYSAFFLLCSPFFFCI